MKARLVIELEENGGIKVTGPIKDKLFCYGLLECAKNAIRDVNVQAGIIEQIPDRLPEDFR